MPNKQPFITTYLACVGWKAQLIVWNEDEQIWEPWQTSFFAYGTEEEAECYGVSWAEAEGIEFQYRNKERKEVNSQCIILA